MQDPDKYLEKLYLPSRWSQRFPSEIIVEKHLEFAKKESEKARQSIPSDLNIGYGPLEKEKIDIFGTDLKNDAPILVFVHGGYWQEEPFTRDIYHFIAPTLYKNGIKSIFVGYELCPNVSLSKIIEEVGVATKKCVEYAKENNSKGLYLAGYSVGSHLVATLYTNLAKNLSTEDRRIIKSAILIAGIYDLTQIPKTSINIPLELDEEEAIRLSPHLQNIVNEVSTSFHVISAENDSPEFKKQSEEFHRKLQNLGVGSTLMVANKVDHFDAIEQLSNEDFEITKLIVDLIK